MAYNLKFRILAQSFRSSNRITRDVWAQSEDAALLSISLELEVSDYYPVSVQRI